MLAVKEGQVQVTALPSWVEHVPYDRGTSVDDSFIAGGRCLLLCDTQTDLTGSATAWHTHLASRVITQAGAESAAQFAVEFDPSFQRTELHFIRVIRGETVLEHARPDAFDILRREQNLERRVLNGRLTVSQVVPDVRPGDIVEAAWTVYGQNPVLQGKFFQWVSFELAVPALAIRHRLRAPTGRKTAFKSYGEAPPVESQTNHGVSDLRWSAERRARREWEPLMPPWEALATSIQVSEAADWQDVACMFAELYAPDNCPTELLEEANRIGAATEDRKERALAILRFVQGRLRYLSVSLGEGSLAPRPLADVWSTGYGDCKDAARLYAALAKHLDVDAAPTLVSTRYGRALESWLPSAAVFDHCIIRAVIDGNPYWLDPTFRAQGGSLEDVGHSHIGWALPLSLETTALEKMEPPPARLIYESLEKLKLGPRSYSPAALIVRRTYSYASADQIRESIANQGLSNFADRLVKSLQGDWPLLAEAEPARIEDDKARNQLTVVGSYKMPSPWKSSDEKNAQFTIPDRSLSESLAALAPKPRVHEIFLGIPRILKRRLEIELPRKKWNITSSNLLKHMTGMKYAKWYALTDKYTIVQEQELAVTRETAAPSDAEAYAEIAEMLRNQGGLILRSPISGGEFVVKSGGGGIARRLYLVFIAIWLLGLLANILSHMN